MDSLILKHIKIAWKKAISQIVFANEHHYDIAFTWYSQGYSDAVSNKDNITPEDIKKMLKLSYKWLDEYHKNFTKMQNYSREKSRIKYIQEHWND